MEEINHYEFQDSQLKPQLYLHAEESVCNEKLYKSGFKLGTLTYSRICIIFQLWI